MNKKPDTASKADEYVEFPAEAPPLAQDFAPAPPQALDATVVGQLNAAIAKSGELVASLRAQLQAADEAHNKNLGMLLLLQQLANQGIGLAPLNRA